MSDAPCILPDVKPISKKELRKLYRQHGFDQRIKGCISILESPVIHPFCCTTRAIRYIDKALDEEIAIIAETVYNHPDGPDKAKRRTEIVRLVVDGVIYQLKHP
jgi:hypothetical protein